MAEGRIWEVVERQRRELLRGERQAASEMVRAYGEVWRRIRGRLDELLQAKAQAEAAGEVVDAAWLYRTERLSTLQRHVEGEMRRFVDFAEPVVVDGQQQAVEAARAHSAELVQGLTERAGMSYEFTRLPFDAVQDLVGFTSDGSPLRELLDELGPAASASVRDALIEGVATGQGPAQIARRVRKDLGGNLVRALRISRTETLRSYREATRRSYQENDDIIDGWTWVCACTARSCASCWAMHGTVHPLSERLDDHPNGRCTAIPYLRAGIRGLGENLKLETGEEQFARLDPAAQDAIAGKAGGLAYRDGAVTLKDFVGRKRDPDWGTMRVARSLQQIVGKEEARKWVWMSRRQDARPALIQSVPIFPTVTEAEKWISKILDLEITFGESLSTAQITAHALAKLSELSQPLPALSTDRAKFAEALAAYKERAKQDVIGGVPALYWRGKVILNLDDVYWKNPVYHATLLHKSSWWSSGAVEHPIWHDAAHWYHEQAFPDMWKRLTKFRLDAHRTIAERVSGYASTSPQEFVAEVFAALQAGGQFDEEIMALYHTYGGM